MQCEAQHPVREEVSQYALCSGRTSFKVWQQCNDGVLRCMLASISGMCLQLYVGRRCFPSMKKWLVEEEEMSAYPEGHRRRGGHESG